MTHIYVLQQLPSTCWIEEAARWVAFGTVPNLAFWEEQERRLSPEFIEDNEPETDFFYQEDFESQNIQIDYERYQSSRLDIYHRNSEAFIESQSRTKPRHDSAQLEDAIEKARHDISDPSALEFEIRGLQEAYGSLWASDESILAELEWLEAQEEPLMTVVNMARLKLFEKLMSGELQAFGWVDGSHNDWQRNSDPDEAGELDGVPNTAWSGVNFDPDTGRLRHKGKTYRHVQMSTERLMQVFPRPAFSQPLSVQADRYPGCLFLADDETGTHQAPKTRHSIRPGRPSAGGGTIKAATVYHTRLKLLEEQKTNPGKTVKIEFVVQTMIEYAKDALDHDLKRTTARDWLDVLRTDEKLRDIWPTPKDG